MTKNYRSLLSVCAGLLFGLNAEAQNVKILCGDQLLKESLEQRFPGFKENADKTFHEALNNQKNLISRSGTTVNVVIHVVYKNPEENLHDSIIQSQMDVLNEDYNRLNADTGNLRSLFTPIAGNANIHFNLHQIIRKQTTVDFAPSLFGGSATPNQMKWDSLGGSNAVDPEHFMNIWVVKIQPLTIGGLQLGQILGFAFPPNNLSNWPANQGATVQGEDGVVIDFRCFGRNNPNPISADGTNNLVVMGRTPSHEVGHYLGLRHIWGDGGGLGGGGNNCTGNDGIDDTPKADAQSNFDCDTTKNSCVDTLNWTSLDAPDLIENFMDYSSETCMNMLTKGQVALMQSVLAGPRAGLTQAIAVTEKNKQIKASLTPNPAREMFTVSLSGAKIKDIIINDISGKNIQSISTSGDASSASLTTKNLSPGTYFIKIISDDLRSSVQKLIVQ